MIEGRLRRVSVCDSPISLQFSYFMEGKIMIIIQHNSLC